MMLQSVAPTPLSRWMPGMWSSRASGTRHHVGPAGPIIAPASREATSTAVATTYQRPAPPRRAGTAVAASAGASTAPATRSASSAAAAAVRSAGGDGDLLEGIVD